MCGAAPCDGTCGGRRGLDRVKGAIEGVFVAFGAPNTPLDEGRYRRYDPTGQHEQTAFFMPLSGIPTITNPTHYREASPTGKPSGGEMFARLPPQNFDGHEANGLLSLSARPTPHTARRVTRAQVDPWGSTQGKISWTPGSMAREAISG